MAEGFGRGFGRGIVDVRSGGTEKGHQVDPIAIEVMKEKGIDISEQESKVVDSWEWADRYIVMGCDAEESCPALYVPKLENWDLDNPKGKPIEEYRRVRDLIEEKVRELIKEEKEVSS
jgi:arsenate reductase